ncbi:MAG: helix-turn-helix domain-containing protein [Deltaproteobacteria bacterium]|nr:helix-turn-helix domain-containing protein [Deltaproteobacteria bacterium]
MNGPFPETIGQYLKRERESRSVSLEELSQGTRMNPSYLEALERDDFQFFPQKEYIEGFLKSYARYLGLETDETLRRYHIQAELANRREIFKQMSLFGGQENVEEELKSLESPQKVPQPKFFGKSGGRKILLQVAMLGAALALSFYIWHGLKLKGDVQGTGPGRIPVSENSVKILPAKDKK